MLLTKLVFQTWRVFCPALRQLKLNITYRTVPERALPKAFQDDAVDLSEGHTIKVFNQITCSGDRLCGGSQGVWSRSKHGWSDIKCAIYARNPLVTRTTLLGKEVIFRIPDITEVGYRFQHDVGSWCTRKRGSWISQEKVKWPKSRCENLSTSF